jgi:hypothetical protein
VSPHIYKICIPAQAGRGFVKTLSNSSLSAVKGNFNIQGVWKDKERKIWAHFLILRRQRKIKKPSAR